MSTVVLLNLALLVCLTVWMAALYRRHAAEIGLFKKFVRKNLPEVFQENWGVLGHLSTLAAYGTLRFYKLKWHSGFIPFIKKRIEEDPHHHNWKAQLPLSPVLLREFASDYVTVRYAPKESGQIEA